MKDVAGGGRPDAEEVPRGASNKDGPRMGACEDPFIVVVLEDGADCARGDVPHSGPVKFCATKHFLAVGGEGAGQDVAFRGTGREEGTGVRVKYLYKDGGNQSVGRSSSC